MHIVLYNPLSKSGGNIKIVEKLSKKFRKNKTKHRIVSLLDISDVEKFVEDNQDVDRFIVIGGDGTLNVLANRLRNITIKPDVYLYRAGTGNDFARSLKKRSKLINITKYLKNLPRIEFNDEEQLFLNGVGLGLDGLIAHKVNNSRFKNNKFNYFRHALESFKQFKAIGSKVILDGTEIDNDKTWLVSVMNSPYVGGGMKIAPKANRLSDELDVVIVKKAPKILLFLIFPVIYLGWHTIFKRYVEIIKVKEAEIQFKTPTVLQIDGEDYGNITTFKVKK